MQKHKDSLAVFPRSDNKFGVRTSSDFLSNSLSGNERNRLFLRNGKNFADLTLLSGVDAMADCRSFALVDFNQDGWQDIALMALNARRFRLFQNDMKTHFPDRKSLRIQLVGGHTGATASTELSNRDGIGAKVLIEFESGEKMLLHKQRGEGFASQNSETMMIGIPEGDAISRLEVRWPSGKTSEIKTPNIDDVVRVKEVE